MQRVNRLIIFLVISTLLISHAEAQVNQYMNFDEDYIKLKVVEDGFYRVTGGELISAGMPSGIAAGRIKVYRRGVEIATRKSLNGDNTLGSLIFYGQRNDGKGDEELYVEGASPHPYYNLFTDTSTYLVSWSGSQAGRSIQTSDRNDFSGLSPEQYHFKRELVLPIERYQLDDFLTLSSGFDGPQDFTDLRSSYYTQGEGWTSDPITKNQFRDFEFSVSDLTSGGSAFLEILFQGANRQQHIASIQLETSTNQFEQLADLVQFERYEKKKHQISIDPALFGSAELQTFRITALGVSTSPDRISFSYLDFKYPQSISLDGSNKLFTLRVNASGRSFMRFPQEMTSAYQFYDVTNPINPVLLPKNTFEGNVNVVVDQTSVERKVYAIANYNSVSSIQFVEGRAIQREGKNYLIIYHPLLNSPSNPAVDQYAAYRESTGYHVEAASVLEIYDQFNFGDPSPLAIKRLLEYGNGRFEHALIIGKGFTVNFDAVRTSDPSVVNVPTYGFPGGDLAFSAGLDPGQPDKPALTVGRINAKSPQTVLNYLDKVKEHESTPFDVLWKKDIIQLSGGQTQRELRDFARNINNYSNILEGDFLGGRTLNKSKSTTAIVETFDGDVPQWINNGVSSMLLFGHSSSQVTDIEIGKVSNPSFGYNNRGKYPVILVNGCNAGDIYSNITTFGEDWINTANKGAIAFLANSGFALSNTLNAFSERYYRVTYQQDELFGGTLGKNLEILASDLLIRNRNSSFYEAFVIQIQQETVQGDPAIRPFAANFPDFSVDSNSGSLSSFTSSVLTSNQDTLRLSVEVKNFAKTTNDSLKILVTRTFPDQTIRDTIFTVPSVKRLDTLNFTIDNSYPSEGINTFTIELDPSDTIAELNELNNTTTFETFIVESQTLNLFPINRAVVGNSQVELIWQFSDPMQKPVSYLLEIGTDEGMTSPLVTNQIQEGQSIESYLLDLDLYGFTDTTTIFWQTRLLNPVTKSDSVFSKSSFTFINDSPEGWGLFSRDQFAQSGFDGITQTATEGEFQFDINSSFLDISTTNFSGLDDVRLIVNDVNYLTTEEGTNTECRTNTINAIVFDKSTTNLERLLFLNPNQGDEAIPQLCGRINPQLIYNFTIGDINNNDYLGLLEAEMEVGDKIVLFNIDSVAYSQLNSGLANLLEPFGVSAEQVQIIQDGDALIVIGEKGAEAGTADLIIDSDRNQQVVSADRSITGIETEGSLMTPIVGPAKNWTSLKVSTTTAGSDSIRIIPNFIREDGDTFTLQEILSNARLDSFNISAVDAKIYPFLYLDLVLIDELERTPAKLNNVSIIYESTPEGVMFIENTSPILVQEGEDATLEWSFINFSNKDFVDSIRVSYTIVNDSSGVLEQVEENYPPLQSKDTLVYPLSLNTIGKVGSNLLRAGFSPFENELYSYNNQLVFNNFLTVEADQTDPVIDVTVDGRYIMDGDIVSPNPQILIKLKDENPFLNASDTSRVNVFLKSPDKDQAERVNYENGKLSLIQEGSNELPTEISFRPGPLEDGNYLLQVEGRDATNNKAGIEPFEIGFEVISESTITHFYPYPNPFSTSCRFVFTLTGSELPDQLKVQIMTISGRVVREIDLAEFGDMHIGNNISDFVWDGTDEYGDQLANGVYFYRVITRVRGENIKRRFTDADKGFKNGFGKLYILR